MQGETHTTHTFIFFFVVNKDMKRDLALLEWCLGSLGPFGPWGKSYWFLLTPKSHLLLSCSRSRLYSRYEIRCLTGWYIQYFLPFFNVLIWKWKFVYFWRMFYGPIVGGLITQNLSFEWAAGVQGGLTCLAVSIGLCCVHVFAWWSMWVKNTWSHENCKGILTSWHISICIISLWFESSQFTVYDQINKNKWVISHTVRLTQETMVTRLIFRHVKCWQCDRDSMRLWNPPWRLIEKEACHSRVLAVTHMKLNDNSVLRRFSLRCIISVNGHNNKGNH